MFDSFAFKMRKLFSSEKVKLLSIGLEHGTKYGDCLGAGKEQEDFSRISLHIGG